MNGPKVIGRRPPAPVQRRALSLLAVPYWPAFTDMAYAEVERALYEFGADRGTPVWVTFGPREDAPGDAYEVRVSDAAILAPDPIEGGLGVRAMWLPDWQAEDHAEFAGLFTYFLTESDPPLADADPSNPPKVYVDARPRDGKPGGGAGIYLRSLVVWPD